MASSAERMRRKRERDTQAGLVEVKVWLPQVAVETFMTWAKEVKHEWLAKQERERLEQLGQMRLPGLEQLEPSPPKKKAPSRPKKATTEPNVTADGGAKPTKKRRAKKEDRQP